MRRMRWSLLAVLLCFSAAGFSDAAVQVGDVRAAQTRSGTPMREAPKGMANLVKLLPYGTRVTVDQLKGGFYAHVKVDDGTAGWVRLAEIVEPSVLTGGGATGVVDPNTYSTADISAAGRQFGPKTERTFRTMDAKLDAIYPTINELEKTTPADADLFQFIKDGWLGGHEELSAIVGPKATLKLIGGDGTVIAASAPVGFGDKPHGVAATDAEFVDHLATEFSPEEEYYLGRSVAAAAIAEHGLDPDPARQAMVRRIGAAIVRISDRVVQMHGGYHFAVLNDPTPNGISGPGGFVFVTRGAMDLARNEDEVAAILAHEIAHVGHKHGEMVLRKTRAWQDDMQRLKGEATSDVAALARKMKECNLCGEFAKLLGQSASNLVKTLDQEGYGKDFEFDADWEGGIYLCEVGYRSSALAEYLAVMPNRDGVRWTTHPSSVERIDSLRPLIIRHCFPDDEAQAGFTARTARYEKSIKR